MKSGTMVQKHLKWDWKKMWNQRENKPKMKSVINVLNKSKKTLKIMVQSNLKWNGK